MAARTRSPRLVLLVSIELVLLGRLCTGGEPLFAGSAPPQSVDPHAGHPMTAAAMQASVDAWFATHPRVGVSSAAAAADTFLASGFAFDADGHTSTRIDTVRIWRGQTILWKYVSGSHTTTSGTGSSDPQVGSLFNQPLDSGHPEFSFTFPNGGTFPFFCRPHEGFDMKGVVIVRVVSDVIAIPGGAALVGFIATPSPNPTAMLVHFRFAQRQAGRARAVVYDARGRIVAVPLDRALQPGAYAAVWDGRTRSGARAAAGVYYLRLEVPGFTGNRRVTLAR